MDRRTFLKDTSLATAGVTLLNFPVFGKNAPSNKVIVGVMGLHGRGSYLAGCFSQLPNVEVGYICDIEDGAIKIGFDALKNAPRKPTLVRDIRELVHKPDMDALIVAAPDHWHMPATMLALHAGKHVYVEKPCCQNPHEGEMMVAAAAHAAKQVQMGSQRRSMPTLIQAAAEVKDGIIGNTYFAKAWYTNNRVSIGYGKRVPVPSTLDFDLWQGPAPRQPYQDNLVHYNWHWFWNWGTGEACNNGTHEVDCCRWLLGVDYPTKVTSSGGRYAFKDDWQTPDTQVATFEFGPDKAITWEGRSCNNYPVEGSSRGFIIYGDKGTLVNLGGGDYKIYDLKNKLVKQVTPDVKADPDNTVNSTGNLDMYHFSNFVGAVRGEATLTQPVSSGYKSVLLCQLANIAQRTSGVLHTDPSNGHVLHDAAAAALWARTYEKGWEPIAM